MKRIFRLSLFTKLILTMVTLATVPVIITGWQLIEINRRGLEGTILELHTNTASFLSENITEYLRQLERQMSFVIKSITEAKGQSQVVLQALLDSNEDFISISLVSRTSGAEIFKVYNPDLLKEPSLRNLKSIELFTQITAAANKKTGLLSDLYFAGGQPRFDALYRISDMHLIFATLSLARLWEQIETVRFGKTGYAFMVDASGIIIAHPDKTLVERQENARSLSIVTDVLKAVSVGSRKYRRPDGKKIVGAYAPVPDLGWGIIIEQDNDEAFLTEILSRKRASRLGAVVICAAILIAFFTARGLSRPIMQLIRGAERVADGDFSTRVHVHTRDELRDLARTFNSMTNKLKAYADLQVDKIIAEKTKTEAVIFSIADGIIMTDHEGRIQLVNNHALTMFGINDTPENCEGKMLYDLIPSETTTRTLRGLVSRSDPGEFRDINIVSNEATKYYKLNAGKVTALKGDNLGIVTVVHDVTLEKELDNMKEEFLHSITHDLRNPMTSIRGFLKFLIDGTAGEVNPQQMKMLATINKASDRLLTMINDILDIAKLEAGNIDLDLEPTDFKEISGRVIEMVQGLSQKKNITIELQTEHAPGPIPADPRLFERVLTNLVSNSIKFTPEDGKIILDIKDTGTDLEAAIIDNGEGIPQEFLGKIFDKFKQVDGKHRGGTGLGLTICKYVVEAHLGTIWVESKLGEGSRFIFRIPKNLKLLTNGKVACG